MNFMIPIYADLVRKGVKKLEAVPAKLRDAVEQYLKEQEEKQNAAGAHTHSVTLCTANKEIEKEAQSNAKNNT